MAIADLPSYPLAQFQGLTNPVSFKATPSAGASPFFVRQEINWATQAAKAYGTAANALGQPIAVNCNISVAQGQQGFEAVLAVIVDNRQYPYPTYVKFADTGWVITCQPNTLKAYPVISNSFSPVVYVDYIASNAVTSFYFANIPSSNFEMDLINEDVQNLLGSNSTIVPNIIGDKSSLASINLATVGASVKQFQIIPATSTPYPATRALRRISISSAGLYSIPNGTTIGLSLSTFLASNVAVQSLWSGTLYLPDNFDEMGYQLIYQSDELYFPYPANLYLGMNVAGISTTFGGGLSIAASYGEF